MTLEETRAYYIEERRSLERIYEVNVREIAKNSEAKIAKLNDEFNQMMAIVDSYTK